MECLGVENDDLAKGSSFAIASGKRSLGDGDVDDCVSLFLRGGDGIGADSGGSEGVNGALPGLGVGGLGGGFGFEETMLPVFCVDNRFLADLGGGVGVANGMLPVPRGGEHLSSGECFSDSFCESSPSFSESWISLWRGVCSDESVIPLISISAELT